jgi:hypothetical protein
MATTTVTLEPQDIAASVQSLKTEFAKANMPGVKTMTRRGAVWVEMPIAHLSDYQFSSSHEHCSWKTPTKKVVIQSKGFAVEHQIHNKAFCMVFRLPRTESSPTVLKKTSAIRHIFFRRSLRAIEELQSLDEKTLAEAVQAPTDYSVLLSALNTEEALASIRAHDPLAGARLRGLEAKRKLVEAEGGALSTAQIAKALQITRQAVDKRRRERKLLGVEVGKKGFRYPAWQIGLPHLAEVLESLGDRDCWEQIGFFLNPSALLEDRTPLDILQEGKHDIDEVLRAASVYGEQGA